MRKILFAAILVCASQAAMAQNYTVESSFTPMTTDELTAPLLIYRAHYKACLEKLQGLLDRTELYSKYLDQEKDPEAFDRFVSCYDEIVEAYNNIIKHGLSGNTNSEISRLREKSSDVCSAIETAYERRKMLAESQYNKLRANYGLVCDRYYSDISLDEFLDGKTPSVTFSNRQNNGSAGR